MMELLYDRSSIAIVAVLFVSMVLAIEGGFRFGRGSGEMASEPSRAHVNTIQAALLGVLGLLLAFTLSLSLQRFDARSEAIVDEANAIGTAYLRSHLLPEPVRAPVQALLGEYVQLRVEAGSATMVDTDVLQAAYARAHAVQDQIWRWAARAIQLDDRPATTGLFIQALNEMIDANARRQAALNRHVPEIVLYLLYVTFVLTGAIVGYAAGLAGHRASFATYIMVALIALLVFIIVDLDRPRRGMITVDQTGLRQLQQAVSGATAP